MQASQKYWIGPIPLWIGISFSNPIFVFFSQSHSFANPIFPGFFHFHGESAFLRMRASQKYSRASFTEIFILWMGPICNGNGLIYKWAAPSSCRKRLLLWKETSEKNLQRTDRVVDCGALFKRDLAAAPCCQKRPTSVKRDLKWIQRTYRVVNCGVPWTCALAAAPSCQERLTSVDRDLK